jgi:hypothetical protein
MLGGTDGFIEPRSQHMFQANAGVEIMTLVHDDDMSILLHETTLTTRPLTDDFPQRMVRYHSGK